jgi:hypothetical protein
VLFQNLMIYIPVLTCLKNMLLGLQITHLSASFVVFVAKCRLLWLMYQLKHFQKYNHEYPLKYN